MPGRDSMRMSECWRFDSQAFNLMEPLEAVSQACPHTLQTDSMRNIDAAAALPGETEQNFV